MLRSEGGIYGGLEVKYFPLEVQPAIHGFFNGLVGKRVSPIFFNDVRIYILSSKKKQRTIFLNGGVTTTIRVPYNYREPAT